jgi:hypothetical protein
VAALVHRDELARRRGLWSFGTAACLDNLGVDLDVPPLRQVAVALQFTPRGPVPENGPPVFFGTPAG